MSTTHQPNNRSGLTRKEDLPASNMPTLIEYESILNSYQDYIVRKGFEPRKIRYLKTKTGNFLKALPVIRKLGLTPVKYIECLEIRFSEISKKDIVVLPGHLSSIHAEDYVTEVMKRTGDSSLVRIEQAAKLRATQLKFTKPEDDLIMDGIKPKFKQGTITPWDLFYYKERVLQIRGETPAWLVEAEIKMREAYNGKKN